MEYLATVAVFFYNHKDYVGKTISSIFEQETKYKFKVLLIDDCSTDSTQDEIRKACVNNDSYNITFLFNQSNKGLNDTFEHVIELIDTKYFILLGGDDYWIDKRKIEKEIDILEANDRISFVHTGFQKLLEPDNTLDAKYTVWNWKQSSDKIKKILSLFVDDWSFYPLGSTFCLRTEIIKQGLVNYRWLLHSTVVGEGTFINVCMCIHGEKYHFIPDITTMYRVRQKSLSHYQDAEDKFRYKANYLKEKYELLNYLNVSPRKEYYFTWYNLNSLIILAYELNRKDLFTSFLSENSDSISRFFNFYYSICNQSKLLMRSNMFLLRIYRKIFR